MSLSEQSASGTHRPSTSDGYYSMEGHALGVGALPVNSYPKSPYSDADIICLDVGPNKEPFRVHRLILSQSPVLEAKPAGMLWGDRTVASISLADIDVPTAHTLVHYLYSGRYQTLEAFEDTLNPFQKDNSNAVSAYKVGTCVYCAAMRYKLPGLAELAKERIMQISKRLPIIDVLSVAREQAFPILPPDEAWYATFLDAAIRQALAEKPELCFQAQFLEQIDGNVSFKKVVVTAMLSSHARGPPSVSDLPTGKTTPMTEPRDEERMEKVASFRKVLERNLKSSTDLPASSDTERTTEVPAEPLTGPRLESVSEEAVPEELPMPEDTEGLPEEHVPLAVTKSADPIKSPTKAPTDEYFDEIEPSPAPHIEPEPFTDETGYSRSKTYQNQRQGKKTEVEPTVDANVVAQDANTPSNNKTPVRATEPSETVRPKHKRTDSAVQVIEPEPETPPATEEKEIGSPEVQPAASPSTVEQASAPNSKNQKKKKKKGGKNATTWN